METTILILCLLAALFLVAVTLKAEIDRDAEAGEKRRVRPLIRHSHR
jgi:hypothetical protein